MVYYLNIASKLSDCAIFFHHNFQSMKRDSQKAINGWIDITFFASHVKGVELGMGPNATHPKLQPPWPDSFHTAHIRQLPRRVSASCWNRAAPDPMEPQTHRNDARRSEYTAEGQG
jgi:hypothetical protein